MGSDDNIGVLSLSVLFHSSEMPVSVVRAEKAGYSVPPGVYLH